MFEQKTSDVAFSYENNDFKRGFIAANVLPEDQGLLCVIGDQQILFFFSPRKESEGGLTLTLCKRFLGYNEEVLDMKFLDDDENFLAVATNAEQVWVYDLSSMSCPYVLAGHTEIVICLDAGRCSNGSTLIVTGSKDNTDKFQELKTLQEDGEGSQENKRSPPSETELFLDATDGFLPSGTVLGLGSTTHAKELEETKKQMETKLERNMREIEELKQMVREMMVNPTPSMSCNPFTGSETQPPSQQ